MNLIHLTTTLVENFSCFFKDVLSVHNLMHYNA